MFTHKNRLKKITYRLMPSARRGVKGKPRGFDEIPATVQAKVDKGSYLIFDGWLATETAVNSLGYRYAPSSMRSTSETPTPALTPMMRSLGTAA